MTTTTDSIAKPYQLEQIAAKAALKRERVYVCIGCGKVGGTLRKVAGVYWHAACARNHGAK